MRRKMNKTISKTAAISLSAIMAMSTVMPAMAAETEGVTSEENPSAHSEKKTPAEEVKEQASAVGTEVKEAETKENEAVDLAAKEENKNISDAGDALDKGISDENGNNKATENITAAENALQDAVNNNPDEKISEAENAAAETENAVNDANKQLEQSQNAADAKIDEIKNAQNAEEAQKIADDAKNEIEKAKENAENNLSAIQGKLEDAKKKYEDARNAADTYNKSIGEASDKADQAGADLTEAKDLASALQDVAEKEMNDTDKAALDIVRRQESQEASSRFNWYQGDRQFVDIMNNYYIPEVLQAQIDDGSTFELDTDFVRSKNSAFADENYMRVFKKDKDGNVIDTLYYNYHLDKNDKKKIVIFEKTPGKREKNVVVERSNDNYQKYVEDQKTGSTENADAYFCQASDAKFEEFLKKPENAELSAKVAEARKTIGRGNWPNDDRLFDLIMKNYYVPEVLGWSSADVSGIYQYNNENLKTSGYEGKNGYEGNAAIIERKDKSGKVIERRYFNYKFEDELVIFEKTDVKKKKEMDVLLNDNYKKYLDGDDSGIVFFEASDENFDKYLKDAKSYNNYNNVKKAAAAAAGEAETAREQVDSLKSQINDLKAGSAVMPEAALQTLEAQLKAAEENFAKAKDKVNTLDEKLEESKEVLRQVMEQHRKEAAAPAEETPAPVPAEGTPAPAVTPAGGIVLPEDAVPHGGRPAARDAAAKKENKIVVEDDKTPLAEKVTLKENDSKEDKGSTVEIEETEVPLAANTEVTAEEKAGMSWWWLLVVAVLGAAGYALYRRNKAKKAAQNQ